MNPLYLSMHFAKIVWNWPSGSGEEDLEKGGALHLNKLQSPSTNDALCQVWLKLAQCVWRRRLFSSPELKNQVSFSDYLSSGICLSVCLSLCLSVCKLFTFLAHLNFNQTWHKASLGEGDSVCSNEGPRPFPRGDNYEIVKIHWRNWKIFFSRTTEPISTKLGTKHPWVKWIQVCSNDGPSPFPRGDNYKNSENTLMKLKNLLLQNHWANFNQTWHQASLGEGDSSLFKWRTN